jgi:choline dehydrogenase-like flavoprotein
MDYDDWAELALSDWDYAHCLPYFRKMETFADGPNEVRAAGIDVLMHIGLDTITVSSDISTLAARLKKEVGGTIEQTPDDS